MENPLNRLFKKIISEGFFQNFQLRILVVFLLYKKNSIDLLQFSKSVKKPLIQVA